MTSKVRWIKNTQTKINTKSSSSSDGKLFKTFDQENSLSAISKKVKTGSL